MTETEAIRQNYNLGVLAGEAREQQRLIKLLELEEDNWRCKEGCCECFGWNGNTPINQVGLLTALIKGEK
jgi:hypothetical protein